MNRDLSVSAFNPEFAFENRNLRLSTNENNTMLSWVNEKGTKEVMLSIKYYKGKGNNNEEQWDTYTELSGIVIGTAVLNEHLVLFTHDVFDGTDRIYSLSFGSAPFKTYLKGKLLYVGNLNFDTSYPIETLVSYETEKIQKVYWTDKKNQPRVINIAADNKTIESWKNKHDCFDFVRTLKLEEVVYVKKITGASGMFPAGVIQYAFTYYDKYGQESNIFYTSPLLYTSHRDRGGSPEDKVDNAFQITVNNVDTSFDYIRIYSIMRTSINGTPICRRVQDISTEGLSVIQDSSPAKYQAVFLDTGTVGDTIDPTELLYKGGESIVCGTIEQKDNTLFMGDIKIKREHLSDTIQNEVAIDLNDSISSSEPSTRVVTTKLISEGSYTYANQLSAYYKLREVPIKSVPCGGFKKGEKYRLGVQFQYKTGKWDDPIYIGDFPVPNGPTLTFNGNEQVVNVPIFKGSLSSTTVNKIIEKGYLKARAVCVYPTVQDRWVVTQGVLCPTMFTLNHRNATGENYPHATGDLYAQSSWFFRSKFSRTPTTYGDPTLKRVKANGTVSSSVEYSNFADFSEGLPNVYNDYFAEYTERSMGNGGAMYRPYDSLRNEDIIRAVEIQGQYDKENKYIADFEFVTMHSPDVEFDTQMQNTDFSSLGCQQVGYSVFKKTFSDIDIQTETPSASSMGAGFVHKSFVEDEDYGIVSGLFYDDYLLDDTGEGIVPYNKNDVRNPFKWMVYLWNRSGSLNNDIARKSGEGVRTALLKKKIISNLRYTDTVWASNVTTSIFSGDIKMYTTEEESIAKVGKNGNIYKGNVDTVLIPDQSEGSYFAFPFEIKGSSYTMPNGKIIARAEITNLNQEGIETPFNISDKWIKTFSPDQYEDESGTIQTVSRGLVLYSSKPFDSFSEGWYGVYTTESGDTMEELRMGKSPIKMKYKSTSHLVIDNIHAEWTVPIDDVYENYKNKRALPIIEITQTPALPFGGDSEDAKKANNWIPCGEPVLLSKNEPIKWEYGDTYYQRWDCLKTYAFTEEDENQVVEIGSFMLETRTNIDGRYDRNRGQSNNLYMSPRNFNLLNEVYSQQNNFFTYKILDKSFYENNAFPNQVTWSLTKQSGADVDMWTQVTLANTMDLDGDKGKLNKIIRFNDQLIAFQDTGISQIMYNENTALTTTEGVPIEIANSGKVQGKRYLSNNIGCTNKWSIAESPGGVYFMDSNDRSIYVFNGQLGNLSVQGGFNTWCKKNIVTNIAWTPETFNNFVSYYDKQNQDVLFINKEIALAYSEKLGAFTSFYDYGYASYLCNVGNSSLWVKDTNSVSKLWKHQDGDYCNFFGEQKPYGMIIISNPEPLTDKIFTNLEFRACVDAEGEFKTVGAGTETEHKEFSGNFFLPFDYLETWNEYQHGLANLSYKNGTETMRHHLSDKSAHLARKFRIWRCDIPRNNMESVDVFDYSFDYTFHNTRTTHTIDRMRNPWLYIKLKKDSDTDKRVEIHDMVMTYYN